MGPRSIFKGRVKFCGNPALCFLPARLSVGYPPRLFKGLVAPAECQGNDIKTQQDTTRLANLRIGEDLRGWNVNGMFGF